MGVLAIVPELVAMYAPRMARYVPPFLLTSLLVVCFGYAFFVSRPRQVVQWLFPGCTLQVPVRSERERIVELVSAWTGVIISILFSALWLRRFL